MALSGVLVSFGTIVAIYGLLVLGLNVKFGYSGLLDIGHAAFFLVGAYTTTLLVLAPAATREFGTYVLGLNWPWIPALVAGTLAAALAGMLVALPAIRLREDYLAIAVLGVSVIARRTIQTEGWLANGPDALRGWSSPLAGPFPLPGSDPAAAAMLGVVVAVFWGVAAWTTATLHERGDPGRLRVAAFGITTLGAGLLAARFADPDEGPALRVPAVAGLLAGAVAAGLSVVGAGLLAVVVFMGAASLFTWLAAGEAVAQHYRAASRRDVLLALGVALAVVGSFVPLVMLGGGDDLTSAVGTVATVAGLVAIGYGLYRASGRWEDDRLPFISVVGLGVVWLFVLRYFVLSLVSPLLSGDAGGAVVAVVENVLWLVNFSPAGPTFNYPRYMLAVALGALALGFYAAEVAANSPFGRVLRAIREDEDVAMALGKDTFSFKVQSMALGSGMAGLAGGLFAIHVGTLNHLMFHPRVTFTVFLMLIIGGTANNRGAILGAGFFWSFQEVTTQIADFFPTAARVRIQSLRLVFLGVLLIVILYYRPEGIWGERSTITTGGES